MTTPMEQITLASAQDFLNALEQHPQFKTTVLRQLLTEALLMLPEKFDQFTERFDRSEAENARRHEQTEARFDRSEAENARRHEQTEARFDRSEAENARRHEQTEARFDRSEAENARRHEQTEALLVLPEKFDQLEGRFDQFEAENARRHEQTEARFDRFEAENARRHEQTEARFDRFEAENARRHEQTEARFDQFEAENARRHEQTEARFDRFEAENARRHEQTEARFDRSEAENARRHEQTESRVKNLEGSAYEAKIHIKLMARCITRHGFEDAEEALSQVVPHSSKLQRTVNAAVREGRLTPEARAELLLADVIISDEQNRHMVAEASLTADDYDITRAADRAAAMKAATGGEVIAAVATENIDDRQRELASHHNVEVIIIPGS